MDTLYQDLRFGLRSLAKSKGVTLVAGATLALGIGLTSTMFSVASAVLLRPLPYADESRIVMVWEARPRESAFTNRVSPADFLDWRRRNDVFLHAAAFSQTSADLGGVGEPERLPAGEVSWSFFDVLGVRPQLGRTFRAQDETDSVKYVAILSDGLWRRRFGASPDVIGREVRLSGALYEVVGVLPREFRFPQAQIDVWLPFAIPPGLAQVRAAHFLSVFARLKPEVGVEQARASMHALGMVLEQENPADNRGHYPNVVPLRASWTRANRDALLLLLGAVGFVLLVASANVANLLLARGLSRNREMAIRAALGAGRGRLVRLLLTESVVLSLGAGAVGLACSGWGASLLRWCVPTSFISSGFGDFEPDARVIAFSCVLSIGIGLLFGVVPALQASALRPVEALKETAPGAAGGGRHRARTLLLASQIALAVVLLVGSGLLVRSFVEVQRTAPGFTSPESVLTARLVVPKNRYASNPRIVSFYSDLLERLNALPGVEAVGVISQLPFSGDDNRTGIEVEGYTSDGSPTRAHDRSVGGEYFRALGVRLLEGRLLNDADGAATLPVVNVNRTMARRYWPGESPVGRRLRLGGTNEWRTVVGVVDDVKHWGLDDDPRPEMYLPLPQRPTPVSSLVLRSRVSPGELTATVRAQVAGLDPDLPLSDVRTLQALVETSTGSRRFSLILVVAFAVTALGLAAVGLASVVAFSVAERRREIGIRMALGAEPRQVLRLILSQGLRVTAAGIAVGVVSALGLTRFLRAVLYGVTATDPSSYLAATGTLAVVAFAAAWLPARRAARVDPLIALRDQ